MGTNYYYIPQEPCPCCKRAYEWRHIGKASWGWCFSLHVYPDVGIGDLPDWQALWEAGGQIVDEYDTVISPTEMHEIIANRKHPNTSRHSVDGRWCLGWGQGTYDLIVGDFS